MPLCPSLEVPEVRLPVEMLWGYPLPHTQHKPALQCPVSILPQKKPETSGQGSTFPYSGPWAELVFFSLNPLAITQLGISTGSLASHLPVGCLRL